MKMPGSLFLVGPMGAGKSTIGRQLAKQIGLDFHDSDHEIENRTGVDIPLIFEIEGEAGFRKREKAVIDEAAATTGIAWAREQMQLGIADEYALGAVTLEDVYVRLTGHTSAEDAVT